MSLLVDTLEPLSLVAHHFSRRDVDGADRLNYQYSAFLCAFLAVLAMSSQIVGETIKCWTPAQFPQPWTEYANMVCWTSSTYFIPMTETYILKPTPRTQISYYQWVPWVFFLQAGMFYFPSVLWRAASRTFGCDLHKVSKTVSDIEHINPSIRDKTVKYLVKHIDRMLTIRRDYQDESCWALKHRLASVGCVCGKRYGNTIVVVYVLMKLVYIGNVAFQLFALNRFLGDYTAFGYEALKGLIQDGAYVESPRFPRVTLCDFELRALGKNQPYTVQCALPLNIFNEKLFIFVWLWIAAVGVVNVLSLVAWTSTLFQKSRRDYITQPLKVFETYDKAKDFKMARSFCDTYLRQDGHFMLRMMGKNTNYVVMGELISALWENYCRHYTVSNKGVSV